ncbi:hypothetical protein [Gayadomonas joobiniege]|uniref:hypothetical protein n=1 Tax=Gayadomonas joobiniege TaxID=1234606 RepID=UPI000379A795|nr:hypothetical protein [Gayadomonas joobiniege]
MQLSAEISLYPLANQQYEDEIWDFVSRVKADKQVSITTNGMSSLVVGEYEAVMQCINREMRVSFDKLGMSIFVCKFVPSDRSGSYEQPTQ